MSDDPHAMTVSERTRAVETVGRLHEAVEIMTRPLVEQHQARLQCQRGCAGCCVDDLSVFDVEAERLRRAYPELLAQGRPHPRGGCAFLDADGGCRVYAHRPYVCRTQGLPLRWLDDAEGETVERRDICPLNEPEGATQIERLPAEACWTLGPIEQQLAGLQLAFGGALDRVSLRALFQRDDDGETP